MEGQSGTSQSQNQYQSLQWSRLVRRNTLQASTPPSQSGLPPSLQFPAQIEIPSNLLPQQPAAYQAQLAHYNKLISSGPSGKTPRLQSSPLPPVVSAQHIQAAAKGSTLGSEAGKGKRNARVGHGNKSAVQSGNGERPLMTAEDTSAKMSANNFDMSNQPSPRPRIQPQNSQQSHQSSSVPSTPRQHARQFSLGSREPSPDTAPNHSPRSAYSESYSTLPALRPHIPRLGCKYETAMAHSRRRMAYSIGSDKLEKIKTSSLKAKLARDDERKLTGDMRELYDRLLPSPESDAKRKLFVQKLEKLLNDEWPGHDIRVHMFGSSGNLLCTDESDVDICITTQWKELEAVCMLAELLAKRGHTESLIESRLYIIDGMEKVICVSTAKVPIVKIWDPELCLACDMNVNNTLALENTRMIKTYVQIDDRVRPLAMIIKYWTKRRIVNDAAFGGTLSSYTWICMIINFLQTRKPPILPALHQRPHLKLPSQDGHETAFADDVNALRGYGNENRETLGELLFQFFRFYGHEFDYDKSVVSVRNGRLASKVDKGWHLATNNRLCVEEPFNTSRNLGNTADDTSFRGLHMELRRAYDLIAEAKLSECCDEYVFPKEEERIWEKPVPQPRPILSRSTSQSRGGKGGGNFRGGKHNNHVRNGNSNRRASSASSGAFDNNSSYVTQTLPTGMTAQEAWIHNQAAQERLHNDLYTTFSVLQAQENNLRLQLYTQSQAYAQAQAQAQAYHLAQRGQGSVGVASQQTTDRNRGSSFDNPPLTAPLRPEMYFYPLHYQGTPIYGQHSPNTYPSSPSMSPALPESRRSLHRSTVTGGPGASSSAGGPLRSHSQPAARSVPVSAPLQGLGVLNAGMNNLGVYRQPNGVIIPNFIADENMEMGIEGESSGFADSPPDGTPKEYIGYYVNEPAMPLPPRKEPVLIPAIPAFGDIQRRRRLSTTEQFPQIVLDRIRRTSRSPSPHRTYPTGMISSAFKIPAQQYATSSSLRQSHEKIPQIANGYTSVPLSTSDQQSSVVGVALPETLSQDAQLSAIDPASNVFIASLALPTEPQSISHELQLETTAGLRRDSPPVVDGSSRRGADREFPCPTPLTTNGVATRTPPRRLTPEEIPDNRASPIKSNRSARQTQNVAMSPLDIGPGQTENLNGDFPHLSPVYETHTPSPTATRKFDPSSDYTRVETKPLLQAGATDTKPALKLALANSTKGSQKQNTSAVSNGHTRAAKSEGSGPGTWHKIPKNKKKGSSSDQKPGLNGDQYHSERTLGSDFERKGG